MVISRRTRIRTYPLAEGSEKFLLRSSECDPKKFSFLFELAVFIGRIERVKMMISEEDSEKK